MFIPKETAGLVLISVSSWSAVHNLASVHSSFGSPLFSRSMTIGPNSFTYVKHLVFTESGRKLQTITVVFMMVSWNETNTWIVEKYFLPITMICLFLSWSQSHFFFNQSYLAIGIILTINVASKYSIVLPQTLNVIVL